VSDKWIVSECVSKKVSEKNSEGQPIGNGIKDNQAFHIKTIKRRQRGVSTANTEVKRSQ
jgi:hypothetical protein